MATTNGKKKIQQGGITPEEVAALKSAVTTQNEPAPSTAQQAASNQGWRALAEAPTDPFDVERIPMNRLRQMRRDPMIGFALHFIKTPLIRAPWYIKCEDAQVAAFVDHSLRKIYSRLVNQYMLSLDFGFSTIVKRWVQEPIVGTYFDPNDTTDSEDATLFPQTNVPADLRGSQKPIWSEGGIQPIIWKPFVALPPEEVEPIWNNEGEFDGVSWQPRLEVNIKAAKKKGNSGERIIDVYHSLWTTHDRDSVHGNIFGYPRIGYAYQYWWTYWRDHSLSDRHFEKDSDPPIVVRHPEGHWENPQTGELIPFRELAILIGDSIRSGSTVAIPSEVYSNFEDRPSNTFKWDIDFLRGGGNFEAFNTRFDYLDVMKLRSVWVPEQALIEGKGGQSSRNVASTFGDAFHESQAVLMDDLDFHINNYLIPQLVALNFPEFEGKVEKVTRGFAQRDIDTMRQILQLAGQQDVAQTGVDLRAAAEDLGLPLLPIERQRDAAIAAQEANVAPPVAPIPGQQAGIVPTGDAPPGNAGQPGTPSLPFSYVQPPERVFLSDPVYFSDEAMASLPDTEHYADRIMKQYAKALWDVSHDLYKGQYDNLYEYLKDQDELSFEKGLPLADNDRSARIARAIVQKWNGNADLWSKTATQMLELYQNAMSRAARVSLDKAGLNASAWEMEAEDTEWIIARLSDSMSSISDTIREDVQTKLANILREMEEPTPDKVINALKEKLTDNPRWMSNRVVRAEIRDLWNSSKLMAARRQGVEMVQAIDAQKGATDEECERRDGEIFQISRALDEQEHPNGTLEWRLLSESPTVETVSDTEILARYDTEQKVIYLSDQISSVDRKKYLKAVGEKISHG